MLVDVTMKCVGFGFCNEPISGLRANFLGCRPVRSQDGESISMESVLFMMQGTEILTSIQPEKTYRIRIEEVPDESDPEFTPNGRNESDA